MIAIFTHAVYADTNAVQTGIDQTLQRFRQTAVGVYIYGAAGSLGANQADGRFNYIGSQQRIAFAALPEAHHTFFYPFNVRQSHFSNFVWQWGKSDAVLAVRNIAELL